MVSAIIKSVISCNLCGAGIEDKIVHVNDYKECKGSRVTVDGGICLIVRI